MSVMSKYFFYQLWNILLIVVSSTAYKTAAGPIQSPRDVIEVLGNSLPKESPTLINYAMIQALVTFPAQLLLVAPLLYTWFIRFISRSKATPRQKSDAYYPSNLTSINYGIAYVVPLLIWVIGFTYAPIAPLILPFCVIFFSIGYFITKYMLLNVHIPQYETGGMHAPMAVRRCLFGMILMQLTMMGVLALKSVPQKVGKLGTDEIFWELIRLDKVGSSWFTYLSMVLAIMPLLVFSMGIFWWFNRGYDLEVKCMPLEILSFVERYIGRKYPQEDNSFISHSAGVSSNDPSFIRQEPKAAKPEPAPFFDPEDPMRHSLLKEVDEFEEEPTLEVTPPISDSGLTEDMHIEPPMSRVPGILDARLESSVPILPEITEDQTDLHADMSIDQITPIEDIDFQVYSYFHPALIGRLPTAWLAGVHPQPISLVEARAEETRLQVENWKRIVAHQRSGIRSLSEDDVSLESVHRENAVEEEQYQGQTVWMGCRQFLDGMMNWLHLQLS
jgi:hypothetical protein